MVGLKMKTQFRWLSLVLFGTMLSCSTPTVSPTPDPNEDKKSVTQLAINSYLIEDPTEFNQQLVTELTGADTSIWQVQPISLTLRYLNGIPGNSHITQEIPLGENPEFPSRILITVIQDGYQDDSLRGEWFELMFQRNSNEIWQIETVKRAFLCHRGTNITSFQQDLCP